MVNQATNICENITLWDGDTNTWTPPSGYLMLIQATTPSVIWVYDQASTAWNLTQVMGQGSPGFTWNGSVLTTNEPQPKEQPIATGAQII